VEDVQKPDPGFGGVPVCPDDVVAAVKAAAGQIPV
jgi:hypothetical protein